jgi:Domain of unknown function (DUF1993)
MQRPASAPTPISRIEGTATLKLAASYKTRSILDCLAHGRTRMSCNRIVHGWFGGDDYIQHLALPDFFFHISIALTILRNWSEDLKERLSSILT